MPKLLKTSLLIVACVLVILALVKIYNGSLSSEQVTAFEWEKQVDVYFSNSEMGSAEDCALVFPLSRTILNAETFGPGATEALLNGILDEEKEAGYFSNINTETLLQKFEIIDGVAYVDFNESLNQDVAGSCKVTAIKSQIENTLTNLPDIDSVVISVNNQTKGILEP